MANNNSNSNKINKIKVISTTDEKLKPGVEIVYMLMKQDSVTLIKILTLLNKLNTKVDNIGDKVDYLNKLLHKVIKVNNLKTE